MVWFSLLSVNPFALLVKAETFTLIFSHVVLKYVQEHQMPPHPPWEVSEFFLSSGKKFWSQSSFVNLNENKNKNCRKMSFDRPSNPGQNGCRREGWYLYYWVFWVLSPTHSYIFPALLCSPNSFPHSLALFFLSLLFHPRIGKTWECLGAPSLSSLSWTNIFLMPAELIQFNESCIPSHVLDFLKVTSGSLANYDWWCAIKSMLTLSIYLDRFYAWRSVSNLGLQLFQWCTDCYSVWVHPPGFWLPSFTFQFG